MLKQTYIKLLKNYTEDPHLIRELWKEIENCYSHKKRFYHTLSHLENLLQQLLEVKNKIENWETILFTLYYHDIIYNATKLDNEERSAEHAEKRMKQIKVPTHAIENCKAQILATKQHLPNAASDTNYFMDADLSILGQEWETYLTYYQNVRKEYSVYPNIIYNLGRKKVLRRFLEMKRIYQTDYFNFKFERQAKLNLQSELENI